MIEDRDRAIDRRPKSRSKSRPQPRCPIRDEPCTLCFPGATGPQDCGLVYLVESDPELREALHETTLRNRREAPSAPIAR